MSPWRPTHAHLRALAVSGVLLAVAVILKLPDAAALGLPFGVVAVWGALSRPAGVPQVRAECAANRLFEGESTSVTVTVAEGNGDRLDPRIDQVYLQLPVTHHFDISPTTVPRGIRPASRPTDSTFEVRSLRWGRRRVGGPIVMGTSRLGAYRSTVVRGNAVEVTTLPLRASFTAASAVPRPAGLIGLHGSRLGGEGTELSGVRPYRPGDRLRRINWAVSSRLRSLHVTTTYSDRDTEVVLLLDTGDDVGVSEGLEGRASALDTTVRAAAAIAEHYLRHGDRVSLADTGTVVRPVRAGSGRAHLRSILNALATADLRATQIDPTSAGPRRRIRFDNLVIVLSPLLRRAALAHIVALTHVGCTVIVVDTLPADVGATDHDGQDERLWALAWRLRLLERRHDIERLSELGVPTVAWHGAGSLDEVLRDASRLSAAPRVRP